MSFFYRNPDRCVEDTTDGERGAIQHSQRRFGEKEKEVMRRNEWTTCNNCANNDRNNPRGRRNECYNRGSQRNDCNIRYFLFKINCWRKVISCSWTSDWVESANLRVTLSINFDIASVGSYIRLSVSWGHRKSSVNYRGGDENFNNVSQSHSENIRIGSVRNPIDDVSQHSSVIIDTIHSDVESWIQNQLTFYR